MFIRTLCRGRPQGCMTAVFGGSTVITRWKNWAKLMGLAAGLVFALGSPVHAQRHGGHHGGRHGGHHGGHHGGFRGRHHSGFGHHRSRGHHGGHHGGSYYSGHGYYGENHARHLTYYGGGNHHSGLGYYGGASVLYGPTIYNSNPYYGRNDQARNYPRQQAGDGLAAGKRYLKEGSYARAVEAFLRSVLAAPQDGVPKLYFGLAHFSVGDYGYAVYAIRRGAARMPNWGEEEMDLRYLYGSRADFARHLDALTAYANRDIADGDAHFLLGYVFYFTGQYTPAWEQFDQALQIDPGDRQAATLRRLAIKRLDS